MARYRVPIRIEKMYGTTVVVDLSAPNEESAKRKADKFMGKRCEPADESTLKHLPWKFEWHVAIGPDGEDHGEDPDFIIE
jgi:hypothetical protein